MSSPTEANMQTNCQTGRQTDSGTGGQWESRGCWWHQNFIHGFSWIYNEWVFGLVDGAATKRQMARKTSKWWHCSNNSNNKNSDNNNWSNRIRSSSWYFNLNAGSAANKWQQTIFMRAHLNLQTSPSARPSAAPRQQLLLLLSASSSGTLDTNINGSVVSEWMRQWDRPDGRQGSQAGRRVASKSG